MIRAGEETLEFARLEIIQWKYSVMKTISLKIVREESWSLRDFVWLLALLQWNFSPLVKEQDSEYGHLRLLQLMKRFSLIIPKRRCWILRDYEFGYSRLLQWESSLLKRFSLIIVWEKVLKFARL